MPPRALLYTCAFLLLSHISRNVDAQFQPQVKTGSMSSYIDGQAMYIVGGDPGLAQNYDSAQSFMIDLSVPWSANNPSTLKLPDGPVGFANMASALTADGVNLFAQSGSTGYFYAFQTGKWTQMPNSTVDDKTLNSMVGQGAVTDPESGIIYIPNGLVNATGEFSMLRLHPDRSIDSVGMMNSLTSTLSSTVAWSATTNTMIYVEASTGGTFTYSPTSGWSQLVVQGPVPSPRSNACLVSAYGGSKMVLFGGYDHTRQVNLDDIHIFDLTTLKWTNGTNAPLSNGRMGAACAFSGEYFIAWGGQSQMPSNNVLASNTVLLYHVNSSSWVSSYIPTENAVAKENARVMAVTGAVLGVVLIVFSLGGFMMYRTRVTRTKIADESIDAAMGNSLALSDAKKDGESGRRESDQVLGGPDPWGTYHVPEVLHNSQAQLLGLPTYATSTYTPASSSASTAASAAEPPLYHNSLYESSLAPTYKP